MLKVLHRSAFCITERLPEGQIFLLRIEGTVQVISAALVIAGRTINLVIIKRISSDNRGGSIEEMEIFLLQQLLDVGGQRIARQRAAGNDNRALKAFQICNLFIYYGYERIAFHCLRHACSEAVAVNGQSATGRHLMLICLLHDERT